MNVVRERTASRRSTDYAKPSSVTAVLGEIRNLQTRLVADRRELEAAQGLRYRIFSEEMGARFDPACGERDEDRFDAVCDHLIVLDTELPGSPADQIVGTYRLLRDEVAEETCGFYTAGEYDIASLVARHPGKRFLELGRSCVMPAYRSKRTIELLWQGIWAYCLYHRIDVMAGCASFTGPIPAQHALPLSFLHHNARATEEWETSACACEVACTDMMPSDAIDLKAALSALPPLIKGYLRLGAMFADAAVIDREFGTTDVLVILPVATISDRYVRYYGADAARFAPARQA